MCCLTKQSLFFSSLDERLPGLFLWSAKLETMAIDLLSQTQSPHFMDEKAEASWMNWLPGIGAGVPPALMCVDHTQYRLPAPWLEPLILSPRGLLGRLNRATIIWCPFVRGAKFHPNIVPSSSTKTSVTSAILLLPQLTDWGPQNAQGAPTLH